MCIKEISPFIRADAECKSDNCRTNKFYIDHDKIYGNRVAVKFVSQCSLSSQHTSGMTVHSRHLSNNDRTRMGESMFKNSVSKIYHSQFNIPDNVEGFSYGNMTHFKSQECLRMVKSEIQRQNRFSTSYMEDIAASQQYYRYLLPDSPIPGYIQYFVQDPIIVHMYGSKQIDHLKLIKNSAIIFNLDTTGSLISKPHLVKTKFTINLAFQV